MRDWHWLIFLHFCPGEADEKLLVMTILPASAKIVDGIS